MASCQTTQWKSTAPYVKLTVVEDGSTEVKANLTWTLEYIANGGAANASVNKAYTVKIGSTTVKESTYNIDGKTGTNQIATGTYSIDKTTASQSVTFSVSFSFNLTWSGTYKGTLSSSGSLSIPAKTSYTITYNANGGSGAPSSDKKYHGTNINLSTVKPTKTGHSFLGWATSSSATSAAYASGASYSGNANATLYAVWKADTYTIKYNANGGAGAPGDQTKTYGKSLTLSSTKPTRANYNFIGWGLSSSATTATYNAGSAYTSNSGATLYAIWELAYTKPRIFNYSAFRCQVEGATDDFGVCGKVSFEYSADKPITSVKTEYKKTADDAWSTQTASPGSSTIFTPGTGYASGTTDWINNLVLSNTEFPANISASSGVSAGQYVTVSITNSTTGYNSYVIAKIISIPSTGSNASVRAACSIHAKSNTSLDGNYGVVSALFGLSGLSNESSYDVRVTLYDSLGEYSVLCSLNSLIFPIDVKAENKGIAFGKVAELDDVFDIGYTTKHSGGLMPLVLEPNTDLNNVWTPNTYIGENVSNYAYDNCPVTSGTFTLLVEGMGEQGQVRQTLSTCSKYKPEIYARHYYQNSWGAWHWAGSEEVVMYEDENGSNGTISLTHNDGSTMTSISASHFRYMEIYYTDNNGKTGGYTKVWKPNGKTVCLSIVETGSNVYFRQTLVTISGSTITPQSNATYVRVSSAGAATISTSNYIKIVRVVGLA